MKVVFVEEVLGTAMPGDVKDVRDGFARNYLIPRGFAVPATRDALRRAEALTKKEEKRQAHLDAEARRLVEQLEGKTVTIRARVGEQGRLYGSVTAADIAEKVGEILGGEFDRRRVLLNEPIREVGNRAVMLRLTRNVSFALPIEVEGEDSQGRRRAAPATTAAPVEATAPAPPATAPVAEESAAEEEEPDAAEEADEEDFE